MTLQGHIQDMPLVDLIEVFQIGSKSGVLYLAQGARLGIIYVTGGRLVDAVVLTWPQRAVVVTGDEAVIEMLRWEQANFIFHHKHATRPTTIFGLPAQLIQASATQPPRASPQAAQAPAPNAAAMMPRWQLELEPIEVLTPAPNHAHDDSAAVLNAPHSNTNHPRVNAKRTVAVLTRSKLIATVIQRIREL